MKECTKCGVIKPLEGFSTQTKGDGRKTHCRTCVAMFARMSQRAARHGLSDLPYQPTAEPHRLWMAVDKAWGGQRRFAA